MTIQIRKLDKSDFRIITDFGKSVKNLTITRWIFTAFSIILAFIQMGGIIGYFRDKVYFGLMDETGSSISFSSFTSMSDFYVLFLLAFVFVCVSIPRLIGNLMYIVQLNHMANHFQEIRLRRAFQFQIIRVIHYFLYIILWIALVSEVANNWYNIMDLISISSIYYALRTTLGTLLVFIYIVSLIEKVCNIYSWRAMTIWATNQLKLEKFSLSQVELIQGTKWVKTGMIITFINELIGNILFNIGCWHITKGLYVKFDPTELIVEKETPYTYSPQPAASTSYTARPIVHATQIQYSTPYAQPQAPVSTRTYVENPPIYQRVVERAPPKSQIIYAPNFCHACGMQVSERQAQFCQNCGSNLFK